MGCGLGGLWGREGLDKRICWVFCGAEVPPILTPASKLAGDPDRDTTAMDGAPYSSPKRSA